MKLDFPNACDSKVSTDGSHVSVASFPKNLWRDISSFMSREIMIFWNLDSPRIPLYDQFETCVIVSALVFPFFWRISRVHLQTRRGAGPYNTVSHFSPHISATTHTVSHCACLTSSPSGNQVDGSLLVANTAAGSQGSGARETYVCFYARRSLLLRLYP